MDKKIITIFFLLIIVLSIAITFTTIKQSSTQDDIEDYGSGEEITDEDLYDELNDLFLSEDDEVEIGDMI